MRSSQVYKVISYTVQAEYPLFLPPASVVEVIETVLSVCLSVCERSHG